MECIRKRVVPPMGKLLQGQRKQNLATVLADECTPQCTTLALLFGVTPENLETMLGKTLNQSRAGPEDEELPEMRNWTGNCAHQPSLLLQI